MKASPSDQRQILDIASFDQRRTALNHRAQSLPAHGLLTALATKSDNARDLRIGAQTELSDVKRELLRAEADVEQILMRITRDETRLNATSSNPKDLEKLAHEVGTLGLRRGELEEVELEIMLRIDEINSRIAELTAREADYAGQIAELEIGKENALATINSELESIAKERGKTMAIIASDLGALYEKIRASNNGIGAAALITGTCNGCHLSINAVERSRIANLAEDEVIRCEECRCILVRGV
ncbi:MAG: C4-type zinc ribbon domain-containing protein [Actinomycetota bacterium]|nr:C4-type zinc ribbon domain-containing protein [Actinomycetota bacterium]